jgi:hypothetical protein
MDGQGLLGKIAALLSDNKAVLAGHGA